MKFVNNNSTFSFLKNKLIKIGVDCSSLVETNINDRFNYFLFMDDGFTLGNKFFYECICKLQKTKNDKVGYIVFCDNDENDFFEKFNRYPAIEFNISECNNSQNIQSFLFNEKVSNQSLIVFSSNNIVFFSTSLSWFVYVDKTIEMALFATGNKNDYEKIKNIFGEKLFIPYNEIKFYINDYKKADTLIKNFRV